MKYVILILIGIFLIIGYIIGHFASKHQDLLMCYISLGFVMFALGMLGGFIFVFTKM